MLRRSRRGGPLAVMAGASSGLRKFRPWGVLPSRCRGGLGRTEPPSVGVARRHLAGDFRAFLEVAANDQVGRRCAGAIALLVAAIAAIEARNHTQTSLPARGLGVDEGLHLVAPLLAFVGAADVAQIVQRAQDLGEPLEAAVEWRHPGFSARGDAG